MRFIADRAEQMAWLCGLSLEALTKWLRAALYEKHGLEVTFPSDPRCEIYDSLDFLTDVLLDELLKKEEFMARLGQAVMILTQEWMELPKNQDNWNALYKLVFLGNASKSQAIAEFWLDYVQDEARDNELIAGLARPTWPPTGYWALLGIPWSRWQSLDRGKVISYAERLLSSPEHALCGHHWLYQIDPTNCYSRLATAANAYCKSGFDQSGIHIRVAIRSALNELGKDWFISHQAEFRTALEGIESEEICQQLASELTRIWGSS